MHHEFLFVCSLYFKTNGLFHVFESQQFVSTVAKHYPEAFETKYLKLLQWLVVKIDRRENKLIKCEPKVLFNSILFGLFLILVRSK